MAPTRRPLGSTELRATWESVRRRPKTRAVVDPTIRVCHLSMTTPLTLIATTAFGLEAVVKRELAALGYEGQVIGPGWIRFKGDQLAICRANLWLRCADRVLVEMARFEAADFDTLFETTRAVAWHEWIGQDGAFPVVGRSLNSQLSSVPACQRTVKKAVVESLQRSHRCQLLEEQGPLFKIQVALLNNVATLTLDTTGPSLHKRGYRRRAAPAPLKETLAAALLELSFWNPQRPLLDPFCGGGTIVIEAARMARNMAPGLERQFAAEAWPHLAIATWSEARLETRDLLRQPPTERLVGTDSSGPAVAAARENAVAAGVDGQVHFQQRTFGDLRSQRTYGCVVTNPPYGQRLESGPLASLYRSIPEVLRRLPSWSHFVLTAHPHFEQLVERQAERRRKLYNGRIECTYYQFHGPRPPRPATAQSATAGRLIEDTASVFGGLTAKGHHQAELFQRRLAKRARHLRRWPRKRGISCFRIYDRDIPEIPLSVDRYEDHLHVVEYDRPHERNRAQHADWLDLMLRTAATTLGIERPCVFFKHKRPQRGALQHPRLDHRRHEITVREAGLQFLVNLSDYVDTGLFLDHRITRSLVQRAAAGTRFLNLFGYTGAFTVYAANGGAAQTTTVDLSPTYRDWSRRNLQLNGFGTPQHALVRADVVSYVRGLPSQPTFDLAVVDPPTFSNSKRTESDWSVQRNYAELLNGVLRVMRPGGVIFFSTNFRRFKFDAERIGPAEVVEISRQTVPEDYRNRRIHRCWKILCTG